MGRLAMPYGPSGLPIRPRRPHGGAPGSALAAALLREGQRLPQRPGHPHGKLAVAHVDDDVLAGPVVGAAALGVGQEPGHGREVFGVTGVAAHREDGLAVEVNHVVAEHLPPTDVAGRRYLPAHKIHKINAACHISTL